MFRRRQLKQEAAQLRGDIDRRACLVHQRIDSLKRETETLVRSPAALPVAFVAGILAERLGAPGIRNAREFLSSLAGQVKADQIIAGLISSSIR
ncbi:MAG TPA: hypothetical protein VFN16_13730 [Saccharospirillum sp.]|nr:hypothetical protein [Saccharospirillum sp.]